MVLIGNTLAVRMGIFGHFETFLHCKFPKHKLVVRNLGWPADEITRSRGGMLMPRPTGFGNLFSQSATPIRVKIFKKKNTQGAADYFFHKSVTMVIFQNTVPVTYLNLRVILIKF